MTRAVVTIYWNGQDSSERCQSCYATVCTNVPSNHTHTLPLRCCPRFDFDPLDVTKTWPEDVFPLQPVGRMVLNRNPDNFFNENEQLAFCPALIVPGEGAMRAAGTRPAGWRCLNTAAVAAALFVFGKLWPCICRAQAPVDNATSVLLLKSHLGRVLLHTTLCPLLAGPCVH